MTVQTSLDRLLPKDGGFSIILRAMLRVKRVWRENLVLDLSNALKKYDIDPMLYYTGDGPPRDASRKATEACCFTDQKWDDEAKKWGYHEGVITEFFSEKWSSVLREYANRYGDRVSAWWIDGRYEFRIFDFHKKKPPVAV